jgi:hypothetical protein
VTAAVPFLRAALFALDEVGDPTGDRQILVDAIEKAQPLVSFHKPGTPKKVVGWAATQMAMSAEDPGRAYSWLRELLRALLEPVGGRRGAAPAPEVAMAMTPGELVETLAPSPRVIGRAIAAGSKLDARALLAESDLAKRVLGVRAIPQASIGSYASELAMAITSDVRGEAIAICQPATDKARAKVAEALQGFVVSRDGSVRAAAIEGIHALRFQLDDEALLAALHDVDAPVRAAAARTIGTGRRGYLPAIESRVVALVADDDAAVRLAALGAITRFPSLLSPALLEPLREAGARGGDEGKTAMFLLGRLGAKPNTAVIDLSAIDTVEEPDREEQRAYVVAPIKGGLAVSDRGTGKQLFVVERAGLLAFVPGRAEVASIREERRRAWQFERFRIPDGHRLGSIAIPLALTHGTPSRLAIAAELVTVWCDHADAPYRFHLKLGDPDVVLDDAPVPGRPPT